MRRTIGFRCRSLLLACTALLFPGCGARGVKVEGVLVKDGQPFTLQQEENLSLSFAGKNAEGAPAVYPATVHPSDGSFVAQGLDGNGLPPGTYKVNVNLSSGGSDPASLAKLAQANQQFAAINGKDFEVAAGDAGKKITIDVAKGTITK